MLQHHHPVPYMFQCDTQGHSSTVYRVSFTRDLSSIVSGGADNSVRFWDIEAILESAASHITASTEDRSSSSNNQKPHKLTILKEFLTVPTKLTPLQCIHITRKNLIVVGGVITAR